MITQSRQAHSLENINRKKVGLVGKNRKCREALLKKNHFSILEKHQILAEKSRIGLIKRHR